MLTNILISILFLAVTISSGIYLWGRWVPEKKTKQPPKERDYYCYEELEEEEE